MVGLVTNTGQAIVTNLNMWLSIDTVPNVGMTTITTTAITNQGTQTPPITEDGVCRVVWRPEQECTGRGVIVSVSPQGTLSQWQCYKVEMDYTTQVATPEQL